MTETNPFKKEDIIALVKQGLNGKKAGINAALVIASTALFMKKDRYENDYAPHYVRVGFNNTRSNTKRIVGILHDVIEDSDWTLDDLRDVGFAERIVNGVDGITKRDDEKYFDFIERCSQNPISVDKKIEDLADNTSLSRNERYMKPKEVMKSNAYIASYQYLVGIKKKRVEPGTRMAEFMASKPELHSTELLMEYSSDFQPN